MQNEIGRGLREGFVTLLELQGTDCEAGGETRKMLISEKPGEPTSFKFSAEFAIKSDDKIRNCITETMYAVEFAKPVAKANVFHHFEVSAWEL